MFEKLTSRFPRRASDDTVALLSDWDKETEGSRSTKPRVPRVQAHNSILEYLSERPGQRVTTQEIADALGYAKAGTISVYIGELLRKRAISRTGNRGSYVYSVIHRTVRRPRKQPSSKAGTTKVKKKVEAPEQAVLPKATQKVLNYIRRHQYELISQTEMAEALGYQSAGGVSHAIRRLTSLGLIERSGHTRDGTRYRVVGESTEDRTEELSPNQPTSTETSQSSSDDSNEQVFCSSVETLVWEFVRATRNTDVLLFLTWLEEKVKK